MKKVVLTYPDEKDEDSMVVTDTGMGGTNWFFFEDMGECLVVPFENKGRMIEALKAVLALVEKS